MTGSHSNFVLLDSTRPDIANLMAAMLQARDAVERRSWSHPQEPTGEAWWADVLADPRGRKRERRTDLAVKQAFYRLADEKRETIVVACSKCDWRAAFPRDDLIASHGADYAMPNLLNHLAAPSCSRLGSHWDRCGVHYVSRSRARGNRSCEPRPACDSTRSTSASSRPPDERRPETP
jgi:hypothetical protein